MIRQHLPESLQGERFFRWRGGEVSRIEGLSDAVFALSLTLLVVSLEVPATFDAMMLAFARLPAFAVCFAILMMCWYYHYQFHRRYGLEDFFTSFLNAILLFVILLYVYPLKFLFTLLFDMWLGTGTPGAPPPLSDGQMPRLMLLYSAGFTAIFLLYALMTAHAYRKRDELQLNPCEIFITRSYIRVHLISTTLGLISMLMVGIDPDLAPFSGMIYGLMGPLHGIHGYIYGRRLEALAKQSPT